MSAQDRARTFHGLHHDGLLILANAWDAGTTKLIAGLGAKAIATTSAAVAWSLGYPDGDRLPVPLLLASIAAMARATDLPLTADIEGGYSADPAAVGETVAAVVDAGAVGINLEDGAAGAELLAAKIALARRAAAARGVDLFINARADVYLRNLAPPERRVEETLARAERYRAAGASGLFVPGLTDPAEISAIVAGTPLPLNLLARPNLPSGAGLAALGVRRLSAGSGIAQAAYGRIATLAADFMRDGDSAPLAEGAKPYAEINALF